MSSPINLSSTQQLTVVAIEPALGESRGSSNTTLHYVQPVGSGEETVTPSSDSKQPSKGMCPKGYQLFTIDTGAQGNAFDFRCR